LSQTNCGIGFRERHRKILKPEKNGGLGCPSDLTHQQIGCFKQCKVKIEEMVDDMDNNEEKEEGEYTRPGLF
jgi:hypothetical protein